jgi:hypothetical protein
MDFGIVLRVGDLFELLTSKPTGKYQKIYLGGGGGGKKTKKKLERIYTIIV